MYREMKPELWGSHAWIFLHAVTMHYPNNPTPQDRQNMRNFFNSVQYILPCDICSQNLQRHMSRYPLTNNVLASKDSLINWLIDIHNEVNKQNHKSVYSYNKAMQKLKTSLKN